MVNVIPIEVKLLDGSVKKYNFYGRQDLQNALIELKNDGWSKEQLTNFANTISQNAERAGMRQGVSFTIK